MRSRLTRTGALGVVAAALIASAAACSSGASSKSAIPGLAVKKLTAGSVDVTITPSQLDRQGARFAIDLDTHSGDPGLDVARSATSAVGGRPWRPARWSGDRAGTIAAAHSSSLREVAPRDPSGWSSPAYRLLWSRNGRGDGRCPREGTKVLPDPPHAPSDDTVS